MADDSVHESWEVVAVDGAGWPVVANAVAVFVMIFAAPIAADLAGGDESSQMVAALVAVAIVGGLRLAWQALCDSLATRQLQAAGLPSMAIVTGVRDVGDSHGHLDYEYVANERVLKHDQDISGRRPHSPEVGDHYRIVYDPRRPSVIGWLRGP